MVEDTRGRSRPCIRWTEQVSELLRSKDDADAASGMIGDYLQWRTFVCEHGKVKGKVYL